MSRGNDNQASRIFLNVFGGEGFQANASRLVKTFQEGAKKKNDVMGCAWSGLTAMYDAVSGQEINLNGRRFKVLQSIGEGGYAFVYLVQELGSEGTQSGQRRLSGDGCYALKKVLVQTREQLALVKGEISAASRFDHPNLLPLLDHAMLPSKEGKEAYLLFPVYREGTLQDRISWMTDRTKPERERLGPHQLLDVFRQVCSGIQHMHSFDPPFGHNDIKPGNVLIAQRGPKLEAAIMDFGSVTPARRTIRSRSDALNLQEWAAQHCSAGYRAPEFWDSPSSIYLDERSDVWALGCLLYALMYGLSPFEHSLGESGGSLQLAVMSGTIKWPSVRRDYPSQIKDLVTWMVKIDHNERPFVSEVIKRVENVQATLPPQSAF